MDLIYTKNNREEGILDNAIFDCEIGEKNDFQVIINQDIDRYVNLVGEYIYLDNSEFGGLVTKRKVEDGRLVLEGLTFRGLLNEKIIIVPHGKDYYEIEGGLRDTLTKIFNDSYADLFFIDDVPQRNCHFRFDRYCTLLEGLEKFCKKHNLRMDLKKDTEGIKINFFEKTEVLSDTEFSEDSSIDIKITQHKNYPTALIALGKGELREREVIYLTLNQLTKEVEESEPSELWSSKRVWKYENTSAEDLMTEAKRHFAELLGASTTQEDFVNEIDVTVTKENLEIGEILQAFEPYTKTRIYVEVVEKICKKYGTEDEVISYKVKGISYDD